VTLKLAESQTCHLSCLLDKRSAVNIVGHSLMDMRRRTQDTGHGAYQKPRYRPARSGLPLPAALTLLADLNPCCVVNTTA
jgi:hypothetical protein